MTRLLDQKGAGGPDARGRPVKKTVWRVAAAVTALLGAAGVLVACGSSDPSSPPASVGAVIPAGHPVPAIPLVDQNGHATSLQAFRGKYVVLAQFLTLCQDECPLTTGAFQTMQQSVQRAGLGDQVVFVEATLDPQRDTPARLRAYQSEFGANWTLLTGTPANLAALWKHFGIYYQKVPEDKPPDVDWWTHQPLTYDMDHTNGFILIDRAGNERFLTEDLPNLHGQLSTSLKSLLDHLGYVHLSNASTTQSYTIPQAMAALSWLVGRNIPIADNS
jgi:protein SCO1/2